MNQSDSPSAPRLGVDDKSKLERYYSWPDGQRRKEPPYRCGCFVARTGEQCTLLSDHDGAHRFASESSAPPVPVVSEAREAPKAGEPEYELEIDALLRDFQSACEDVERHSTSRGVHARAILRNALRARLLPPSVIPAGRDDDANQVSDVPGTEKPRTYIFEKFSDQMPTLFNARQKASFLKIADTLRANGSISELVAYAQLWATLSSMHSGKSAGSLHETTDATIRELSAARSAPEGTT